MLARVLSGIEVRKDPNVLVGYQTADDGGVYRLTDELALVQTVDFFTPVVDDPWAYGQIAAANALSDIYAMGGTPRCALSIVGFPPDRVEESVLAEMLKGGTETMNAAEVSIIGGHSVQDAEIKFGYCVSGTVHPAHIYTNSGARPGDVLVLTKPLGTGIITTGIKFGITEPAIAQRAIDWMRALNVTVVGYLGGFQVNAVTDITGYGLIGHAWEMAVGSGVTLALVAEEIPILEGTLELARRGPLPGSIQSNREYLAGQIEWGDADELTQAVLGDPQTSGGLLLSLPDAEAHELCHKLEGDGVFARRIGAVRPSEDRPITVRGNLTQD